jgi:hypothetical protein
LFFMSCWVIVLAPSSLLVLKFVYMALAIPRGSIPLWS